MAVPAVLFFLTKYQKEFYKQKKLPKIRQPLKKIGGKILN